LGNVSRNERAIQIGQMMATKPGQSLPQLFPRRYDLKETYKLFANPEASPDELQATHRELVMEALGQLGTYLLPEDTTEVAWTKRKGKQIPGLGLVGGSKEKKVGFLLHTTLALRWPGADQLPKDARRPPVELLGIADQQYYVRKRRPAGEKRSERLQRDRESELWEQATYRLGDKPPSKSVRWVRVCDRGGDIYEALISFDECGHGYVVRAAQDRALLDEEGRSCGTLFEFARSQASLNSFELELRGREGKSARTVQLQVGAARVCIRAPYRPGQALGKLPPVNCTVVRVWEENPPEGEQALEWILLCDGDRTTFELARECAVQYSTRWLCEEFHKGLKTGQKVEDLQLETGQALMAATAVKSVAALRLLDLREHGRQEPDAPAERSGLNEVELEVLAIKTGRKIETVRDAVLALGKLGGHLNRKSDGMPGWITLWRGWLQLQPMVEGFLLAHKRKKSG
jgi:hypothetical protein